MLLVSLNNKLESQDLSLKRSQLLQHLKVDSGQLIYLSSLIFSLGNEK